MDRPLVECRSCVHFVEGLQSLDDAPPRCWDCTRTGGRALWEPVPSAFSKQEGGSHYTDCAIQPFEYSMANKLDPMQHTAVKYVTRFRSKGGIADLRKAIHTIELLIEWEEKNAQKHEAK